MTRDLDIVLWGATGFSGELAVAYLKGDASKLFSFPCTEAAAPQDLRWALCGRNRSKLEALEAGVEIIVCDAEDRAGIEAFVKRTRVVVGLAGPFVKHSDLVVEACARHGTHWVDISGEVVWSRSLIDRFGDRARANGACIVNQCGYDSIPSDLGTLFAVDALRSKAADPHTPIRSVTHYVCAVDASGLRGALSGGSIQTMLAMQTHPVSLAEGVDANDPFLLGGEPPGGVRDEDLEQTESYFDEELDTWIAPFFMHAANSRPVRRSNMLVGYGPQFSYRELEVCASEEEARNALQEENPLATSAGELQRLIDGGALAKSGDGPSPEVRAGCRFHSILIAVNEAEEDVAVMVSGGQPGYEETARMVVEAGLALVYDGADCPGLLAGGGFLTPAACMGTALIHRLRRAGIRFEVLTDASRSAAHVYAREAISKLGA